MLGRIILWARPCVNAKTCFALLLATLMPIASASETSVQADHLSVTIISESAALVPGQITWLGLLLRHDPHWHTYWINPGDSGLPTRLRWMLPEGFVAEDITWPAPTRFAVGELYNFGYSGDQLLPVAVHVPADAKPGEHVRLVVEAKWLVCREACIPGKATLSLGLPIAASHGALDQAHGARFEVARKATPKRMPWQGNARIEDNRIAIRLEGDGLPSSTEGLDVFAVDRRIFENAPAKLRLDGDALLIDVAKNEYFDQAPAALDLVFTQTVTNGHDNAWQVRVPLTVDRQGKAPLTVAP